MSSAESSSSAPRTFYCRWDYCSLPFPSATDLNTHLQSAHIAHARAEPILGKRKRIAVGTYVVVSQSALADRLPIRFSQTTGDITTTTDANTTSSHPYPPSFPSQLPLPPALLDSIPPHSGNTQAEAIEIDVEVEGEGDVEVDTEAYLQFPSPPDSSGNADSGTGAAEGIGGKGETASTQEFDETQSIQPSCGQPVHFRPTQTQLSQIPPAPNDSPFDPPTQPFGPSPARLGHTQAQSGAGTQGGTQSSLGSGSSLHKSQKDSQVETGESPSGTGTSSGSNAKSLPKETHEDGTSTRPSDGSDPSTSSTSASASSRIRAPSLSMAFGAATGLPGAGTPAGPSPAKTLGAGRKGTKGEGVGFGWGTS